MDRRASAYHEAGHFVMGVLLRSLPQYVSIKETANAGGICGGAPREIDEIYEFTRCQTILFAYAGQVAQELHTGDISGCEVDEIFAERDVSQLYGVDPAIKWGLIDIVQRVMSEELVQTSTELVATSLLNYDTLIEDRLDTVILEVYRILGDSYVSLSKQITEDVKELLNELGGDRQKQMYQPGTIHYLTNMLQKCAEDGFIEAKRVFDRMRAARV